MSEIPAPPAAPPHAATRPASLPQPAARPAPRGIRSASTAPARPGGPKEPARV
ncbi:hypothetical protein GCM10010497_18500 [Streptomyces cinereoruber]|uniref:Uncharacterized protein n=1 Tax=Streptomyces cinereoruber TaxID=67260 RepID=A0AAV4KDQ0_9ACTN|nr:hypothetical protein GCM10010497_18500 [Streptomyces cinereoruber]